MHLHKWVSNKQELLNVISLKEEYCFNFIEGIKVLRMIWKPEDNFAFTVSFKTKDQYTKRDVVSETAKLFDLLGLICPVVIHTKIFMQELWHLKIDWKEYLTFNTLKI